MQYRLSLPTSLSTWNFRRYVVRILLFFYNYSERTMAEQYGNVDYWDGRYSNDKEPFEWYLESRIVFLSAIIQRTIDYWDDR